MFTAQTKVVNIMDDDKLFKKYKGYLQDIY